LVTGAPGYGKSLTVDNWSSQTGAIYLRAKEDWTPSYFMADLAEVLDVDPHGRAKDLFTRCVSKIGVNQTPLIIDEVEFALRNNAAVLEHVRDISDMTEIIVILIGMEQVRNKIARHMQLASRIGYVCSFQPASLADVAATCAALAECDITPDLVKRIHHEANGRMRLVLNAISRVEQIAKALGMPEIGADTDALKGVKLCEDWQTRLPSRRR
ncbi:MAG TPA: ATP-binding protein, partial [Candidatus Tenderia sp.]|nr:ATP-binding protein [Candidatus Tenderia sp.]